jgi:hypothetical protein
MIHNHSDYSNIKDNQHHILNSLNLMYSLVLEMQEFSIAWIAAMCLGHPEKGQFHFQ